MADVLLSRFGALAIDTEATKGTAIPAGTAAVAGKAALMVRDLKFTADVKTFERKYLAAHASRYSHLVGQCLGQLSFTLDLRHSAADAGTEDKWGELLDACGVVDTGTSTVVYKPASKQSQHTTLTMYAFIGSDGTNAMRVGLRGAMGTVKFSGKVGEPITMEFQFWGVHDRDDTDLKPQSKTLLAPTHETGIPAVLQAATVSWGGAATPVSSFGFDLGNTVTARESIADQEGCLHYAITDRAMTGSVDLELDTAGTDLTKLNTAAEVALSVSLSQASPTRTLAFAVTKAQPTGVSLGERNGITTAAVNFAVNTAGAAAGDDEFSLTIS